MFTGHFPESVLTTQCGHLFHSECILLCLNSSSKCPFCSLHVKKNQLVKLHFVIDSNWKNIAASLKNKTDASIINLDETMNISLNNEQYTESLNKSIDELQTGNLKDFDKLNENNENNLSLIEVDFGLTSEAHGFNKNVGINKQIVHNSHNSNTKVLLTTSVFGLTLSKIINNFILILNAIIPNSKIQKRLFISESNLIEAAMNESFTHICIIIMHQGFPTDLCFLNLLENKKHIVSLSSFKCVCNEYIFDKIKTPQLLITKYDKLSKPQEFILDYISAIFQKQFETPKVNDISITFCDDGKQIKFKYSPGGLSFNMCPMTFF
ncbi:Zinc finger, RING-type,Zinc finger, RING/FYVE/PHD-type,Anticodon-binding [Cinara cedri]|uniref:Zinc finger, RING-type,Zinc finger, RING/FYVE/PHD-type,Anticodon-binding n=1 Tax=Cinara cedri TaxID=506608 RepID=A0A5E4N740_9HEMI|nr:Zinc finger, RING-type,Zinc finger, RING/FYVE/PHD-type,Anticodon-binding [Cinara cedri]